MWTYPAGYSSVLLYIIKKKFPRFFKYKHFILTYGTCGYRMEPLFKKIYFSPRKSATSLEQILVKFS